MPGGTVAMLGVCCAALQVSQVKGHPMPNGGLG